MFILNGELCRDNKIYYDEGLQYGYGVFETILIKDKPLFLREHIRRMNHSLMVLGIDRKLETQQVMNHIQLLDCKNCVIKIIITSKNEIITKREITYQLDDYIKGFSTTISSIPRNPKSHTVYMKSLNYTDNIIERQTALKKGYDEVIFINTEGYLTESSISNLFFIKDDILYTAEISCGLLNGIIRDWIIKYYTVKQGRFTVGSLLEADGAFLTNSIMGIMKINAVDKIELPNNAIVESIRNRLNNEYDKEIYL